MNVVFCILDMRPKNLSTGLSSADPAGADPVVAITKHRSLERALLVLWIWRLTISCFIIGITL